MPQAPGAIRKGTGAVGFTGVGMLAYLLVVGLLPAGGVPQLDLTPEQWTTFREGCGLAGAAAVSFAAGALRDVLKRALPR